MQTAEFNHEDFTNTSKADESLMVRFFHKNVNNKLESQAQGRPVFTEKTYIEIRVAGQRDVQVCRPVTFADKQRFPRHFEAFEKRVEAPTEGMPLVEWPAITRTQAEEMAFMNVKTVEQLAGMKDANLAKFMNGYKLRDKAVEWLEYNQNNIEDAEKAEMRETIETMKRQIALLTTPSEEAIAQFRDIAKDVTDTSDAKTGLKSTLDETPAEDQPLAPTEITPDTTEAVKVPAAPAGVKKRASRRNKK